MKVQTTRFGELKVAKEDVINFPNGLLGFENLTQFIVVDPDDNTLILWLQSLDNDKVAFPIIEPKLFKSDYIAKLLPTDLNSLELENLNNAIIYSIITIPADIVSMTANLKAPIIINNAKNIARQIVLQDNKLSVQYEMYSDLKKSISNLSSDDSRRTKVEDHSNDTPSNLSTAEGKVTRSVVVVNRNKNAEAL